MVGLMVLSRAKRGLRTVIAAPGIRHGLRWFLRQSAIPAEIRSFAHRKLAKRARFGDRTFVYTTPERVDIRLKHSGTANYLYWLGTYEHATTSLFGQLARAAEVILDIGAADGIYALLGAAASTRARIIAFEPGRAAARTAATNFELNHPLSDRIELHDLALGDTDEETTLYVAGETGGTSSLNPSFRAQREEQRVLVRRGDAFLAALAVTRVDLVKIDTESTEPQVLRGLLETLRRDHPDVICEVLPGRTETALEEILAPLGYRYYWVTERGLVPQDHLRGDAAYHQPNFLFTVRTEAELAEVGVTVCPS